MLTMACFATTGTVCVMNLRRSPRFSLLLALPLLSVYKASVANSTRKIECRKTLKKRSPFGAEAPQCRRWMRKCLQYHFCDILSNINEVPQHKKNVVVLWDAATPLTRSTSTKFNSSARSLRRTLRRSLALGTRRSRRGPPCRNGSVWFTCCTASAAMAVLKKYLWSCININCNENLMYGPKLKFRANNKPKS